MKTEEGGQEVREAKTCWEERGWGSSPSVGGVHPRDVPGTGEALGTPTDLITDMARAAPPGALGSEAEPGPPSPVQLSHFPSPI